MKETVTIKNNYEFRRMYAKGKNAATPGVVVYYRPNRFGHNRIGVTVSTKVGKAVVRNRVRRRLREVYRLNEDKFTPGWDIVVVARSRCIQADFGKLTNAYLSLAEKAGILRKEQL